MVGMSDPSGTGGTGATGGTGVPPAPVYADDIKRVKKKENLRKQVINTVVRFLDNVLTKPELWSSSDFKPIRDRCYRITSDPVKYPPPLQMCSKTASNPSDDTCLTLGFAKLIYKADLIKVCNASPPLVQVQEVSSRFKSHFCNQVGKDEMVNQVTASVVDGDGIVLTLKIASQMMGFVGLLAEGVVLKLLQLRTLSFRYRAEDPVTQKLQFVYCGIIEGTLLYYCTVVSTLQKNRCTCTRRHILSRGTSFLMKIIKQKRNNKIS